jgi:hypothetical protein
VRKVTHLIQADDQENQTETYFTMRTKFFNIFKISPARNLSLSSATFTLNTLLIGMQTTLNAKMLSQFGEDGNVAGVMVSTFFYLIH